VHLKPNFEQPWQLGHFIIGVGVGVQYTKLNKELPLYNGEDLLIALNADALLLPRLAFNLGYAFRNDQRFHGTGAYLSHFESSDLARLRNCASSRRTCAHKHSNAQQILRPGWNLEQS
jgi:hypothetical protein